MKRNPIRDAGFRRKPIAILYYYRCPKCDHVSAYASYNDWLSCGYRRCGVRFIRFGNTITKDDYERVWGGE